MVAAGGPEMIPLMRVTFGSLSAKDAPADTPSANTGRRVRFWLAIQFSSTYLTPHLSSL